MTRRVLVSPKPEDPRDKESLPEWFKRSLVAWASQIFEQISFLIKHAPDHELSPAEVAAGVTPSDFRYPPGDVRRYGFAEDATGAVNREAFESAIDVAAETGGAVLDIPPGDFTIDATITVDINSVVIRGSKRGTIFRFNPASTDVLFDFDRGASSSEFCGVEDCQFISNNSTDKTAIRVDDARTFWVRNVLITHGGWDGSGSTGVHIRGRELAYIKECQIICARPVVLGFNPNFPTIHTDFFAIEDGILGSTETTGTAIEVEDGVNISNLAINRIAFVLGKWKFKWVDTSSTIDSYALSFESCRSEQASDATGFTIELNSTSQDIKQVLVQKFFFDPGCGGIKGRKVEDITVKSCSFPGPAGVTNFDITFGSLTKLNLENTFVQALSTITLTNAVFVEGSFFNPGATSLPADAEYIYDQGAIVSQRHRLVGSGVEEWEYTGTLADNATLNLPWLRASHTHCTASVMAYSATGPTISGGIALWSRDGTTSKVGGTANFVVAAAGVELRCLDGGSGLVVINVLGQDVTLTIKTWGK
jgi:hypothetical protein